QYSIPGMPEWLTIHTVDTDSIKNDKSIRKIQPELAKKALCGKPGWRILFGLHALHSSGAHGADKTNRKVLEPVITDCGVQAYFSGHDHHQEHTNAGSYQHFIQG